MEATRNAPAEGLSVYSTFYLTLPKVRAAQAKTLAKCVALKVIHWSFRKETERFGRSDLGER